MCLCDPDTAVLIGGETADQNYITDSIWKLEIGVLFSHRPLVQSGDLLPVTATEFASRFSSLFACTTAMAVSFHYIVMYSVLFSHD